jgi:hypothetical protein
MPKKEYIAEHRQLFDVLSRPTKRKLGKELAKQKAEVKMRGGDYSESPYEFNGHTYDDSAVFKNPLPKDDVSILLHKLLRNNNTHEKDPESGDVGDWVNQFRAQINDWKKSSDLDMAWTDLNHQSGDYSHSNMFIVADSKQDKDLLISKLSKGLNDYMNVWRGGMRGGAHSRQEQEWINHLNEVLSHRGAEFIIPAKATRQPFHDFLLRYAMTSNQYIVDGAGGWNARHTIRRNLPRPPPPPRPQPPRRQPAEEIDDPLGVAEHLGLGRKKKSR